MEASMNNIHKIEYNEIQNFFSIVKHGNYGYDNMYYDSSNYLMWYLKVLENKDCIIQYVDINERTEQRNLVINELANRGLKP